VRRNLVERLKRRHLAVYVLVGLVVLGALASVAIAQSNSAFNLNSPAAYPVDI